MDIAVVDPSVEEGSATNATSENPLVRALARGSAPPFVLYLSLGQTDILRRATLVRLRPAGLAVQGVDDSPDRLRDIIRLATAARPPAEVLSAIAGRIAPLKEPIRLALTAALNRSLGGDSVSALAASAGCSNRVVEREMDRVGLAKPREWLVAGRVLEAYNQLRRSNVTVCGLLELMGYSAHERLARDVALMIGCTPSEMRRLSAQTIVARIATRLTTRPPRMTSQRDQPEGDPEPADLPRAPDVRNSPTARPGPTEARQRAAG